MYFTFIDVQRANADLFCRLASKGIEAFEKTMALTSDAMRSMVNVAHRDALGVATDRRQDETVPEQIAAALPSPEVAEQYSRQLFDIASDMQAEVVKWTQEQIGAQQERMRAWADQAGRATGAVSRAAEQFSRTAQEGVQQTTELAERGAREAASMTEAMSKTARRGVEQSTSASKH